jgi:hypothetical protein
MFSYEVTGSLGRDGEIYCLDCSSPASIELEPVFAGDEDTYTCNECGEILGDRSY